MSWKRFKLGELLEYHSVRAKEIGSFGDLEFCGVSNEDGIIISKYAAEDKADEYKVIEKGCFAYNPYRINVGSIALMKEGKKGLISPAYVVFKPKPNSIIPELLLKFLKSPEGLRQIKLNARGTVRQALRFEDLCKIEITIPTYDEQLELYKNLEITQIKCYRLKQEHSYQLSLLKKIRQQIIQDAIQGKLVPQNPNDEPANVLLDHIKEQKVKLIQEKKIKKEKPLPPITPEEIPFIIPVNWVWCRLGEICHELSYGTSQKADDSGEVPVLRMGNITTTGEILYSNLKYVKESIPDLPNLFLNYGDMVFNRTNSFELVGKCGVFNKDEKYTLASYLIRVRFPNTVNSLYISQYINSKVCRETQIEPDIIQQNGQANFNGTKLSRILIPFPPIQEQHRIVTKIEQIMTHCNELEQCIKQSQKYTQGLLQTALKEALEPRN